MNSTNFTGEVNSYTAKMREEAQTQRHTKAFPLALMEAASPTQERDIADSRKTIPEKRLDSRSKKIRVNPPKSVLSAFHIYC